jgi:hypothetical protein
MSIKNLFQVYTLLICLISTIILLVCAGIFLSSITNIIIPQYTNYSHMIRFQSNESYLRHTHDMGDYGDLKAAEKLKDLSPAQLTQKRMDEKTTFLENTRGSSISTLIGVIEWSLIALVFFLIHWRLYKRSKE